MFLENMNVSWAPIPYNAQMVEDIFPEAANCLKKTTHGNQAVNKTVLTSLKFYIFTWKKKICYRLQYTVCISWSFFTVKSTNISLKYHKFVFTMWRDVGKGDLHEALQGQEGQTGSDD